MTRSYRAYTDDDVIREAAQARSMSGLLRAVGIKPVGANYISMKRNLQRLNINTDHWTGYAWSKNQKLKDYSDYTVIRSLKPHLIKERGHQCEVCKLIEWMGRPITLEIHHLDGDRTNNAETNLQIICPLCHSYTDNWRNRK